MNGSSLFLPSADEPQHESGRRRRESEDDDDDNPRSSCHSSGAESADRQQHQWIDGAKSFRWNRNTSGPGACGCSWFSGCSTQSPCPPEITQSPCLQWWRRLQMGWNLIIQELRRKEGGKCESATDAEDLLLLLLLLHSATTLHSVRFN